MNRERQGRRGFILSLMFCEYRSDAFSGYMGMAGPRRIFILGFQL